MHSSPLSRRRAMAASVALAGSSWLGGALAQAAYPNHPLKVVVPFPAGGLGIDMVARIVANELSTTLKQPVVVDNRPGGGTVIGTSAVATAPADGYTLLVMANSFTANPYLRSLPYDSQRDFTPVALMGFTPHVLAAKPQLAAHTLAELVATAKAHPSKLNYASIGNGTASHLAGEALKKLSGVELTHIPYKGQTPALTALMAGEVDLSFANLSDVRPYLESKKLKVLAISAPQRDPSIPTVPTMKESGLPDLDSNSTYGIMVRSGTPPAVVELLNKTIDQILKKPEVRQQLNARGVHPLGGSSAEFAQWLDKEGRKYAEIIKYSGAKVD